MSQLTLRASRFEVQGHGIPGRSVFVEPRPGRNGREVWVCFIDGYCVSTEGDSEYEPMPSSRDEDFIRRTRFATPEEALQNFGTWQTKIKSDWA